jgi:hypothetical protein
MDQRLADAAGLFFAAAAPHQRPIVTTRKADREGGR